MLHFAKHLPSHIKWERLSQLLTGMMIVSMFLATVMADEPIESQSGRDVQAAPVVDQVADELALSDAIVDAMLGKGKTAAGRLARAPSRDSASLFTQSVCLLEAGEVRMGIRLLEELITRPDAPAEAYKYLAVAYLHSDDAEMAESTIAVYLSKAPDDRYAHYLKGVADARLAKADESRDALQQAGYTEEESESIRLVSMQLPVDANQRLSTVQTPTSQRFPRDPIQSRQSSNPFSFTVLTANEFDSNVPLRPFFTGLGSNFDHDDGRFLIASFADLKLLDRDEFNMGMIGSTYNTFQYELTQFNIEDYMGGGYANALLLDNWVAGLRYEFHTTLVNDSQFANDHRLTPSVTRLGQLGHTTIYGEYNPMDVRAPALIPEQNQSADVYRFGATQALYTFEGNGRIYAGYQFASAFAQGTDFDRDSHMVTGRIERPLARNWIADFDCRFFWDLYENPNSLDFFQRARRDDRLEIRTGVQKNFVKPVSLRLDYTYINNDSSTENLFGVRFFDYSRHVLSSQLIFSLY